MFRKRKTIVDTDRELLQNMKIDIENKFKEKGVMISGIDIAMNPRNISISIQIRCFPLKTHQLL
ncbi:MAG: hypothetical protein ACYDG2_14170 [Ruminiclostridium sp.]